MYHNKNTTICIKNLPEYNDQVIYHFCGNFGKIITHRFVNTNDPNRMDAIVQYEQEHAAMNACQALNRRIVGKYSLYVEFIRPEPLHVPNNRYPQDNNRRFPNPERSGNPMGMNMQNNFRDFNRPANDRQFQFQGRDERPLHCNFGPFGQKPEVKHVPMQFDPRMNGLNDRFMNGPRGAFNMGIGMNSPIPFQGMDRDDQIQPMGHHGPLGPNGTHYRPIINQNPMMQRPAGSFFVPPQGNQVINMRPEKFEQGSFDARGPVQNIEPNRAQGSQERPVGPEDAIAEALAKNSELQSKINNPDIIKTLIDVFRKEVSAIVGSQNNNNKENKERDNRHNNERESNRARSHSRNKKEGRSRSPRRHRNSDKKKRSHSRSRSKSHDHGRKESSSKRKYSDGKHQKDRSEKKEQRVNSKSEEREHRHHSSSAGSECGEVKVSRSHKKKMSHREHKSRKHSHKERSRSRERGKKSYYHKRSESKSRSRSKSRSGSKDSNRHRGSHGKYRYRSRSHERGSGYRDTNKVKNSYGDKYNQTNPFVIEDVPTGPLQGKEPIEECNANKMQGVVLEDQDLSQTTTTTLDSLNMEKTSSQESAKLLENGLQQHKVGGGDEKAKKSVRSEVELKYPKLDGLFSGYKYHKEPQKNDNKQSHSKAETSSRKEEGKVKFVYSSQMEENKESNYPFSGDYNWSLASVLGMYPDDLMSLNFEENLKSNLGRLLEAPQAWEVDEEMESASEDSNEDLTCDKIEIIISETEEEKEERNQEMSKNETNGGLSKLEDPTIVEVKNEKKEEKLKVMYEVIEKSYEEVQTAQELESQKGNWILTIERSEQNYKGESGMREEGAARKEIYEIRMEEDIRNLEIPQRGSNYCVGGSDLNYLKEKLRMKHTTI